MLGLILGPGSSARGQDKPRVNLNLIQADPAPRKNGAFERSLQAWLDQPPLVTVLSLAGGMGVTGASLDETLRSHLAVPAGQGVVIVEVSADSPAAKAGLKPRDVLVKLGDAPLTSVDALDKLYGAAGDKTQTLHLIRAGKPMSVQIAPQPRNDLTVLATEVAEGELWVGVSVSPADETLRAQLNLAEGRGLVVTELMPDSPATKAGMKPNDIVVALGGKPLGSAKELVDQIQAAGEKPVNLDLIRGGKAMSVEVTPVKHPRTRALLTFQQAINAVNGQQVNFVPTLIGAASDVKYEPIQKGAILEFINTPVILHEQLDPGQPVFAAVQGQSTEPLEKRLDEVIAQLKALCSTVEEMKKSIKKN
jgi:membrane-associated protease RseP (regulator of RpoE activity)